MPRWQLEAEGRAQDGGNNDFEQSGRGDGLVGRAGILLIEVIRLDLLLLSPANKLRVKRNYINLQMTHICMMMCMQGV